MVNSDKGLVYFSHSRKKFEDNITPDDVNVECWYETIQLPSDEEIKAKFPERNDSGVRLDINVGRQEGAHYILGFINNKK